MPTRGILDLLDEVNKELGKIDFDHCDDPIDRNKRKHKNNNLRANALMKIREAMRRLERTQELTTHDDNPKKVLPKQEE